MLKAYRSTLLCCLGGGLQMRVSEYYDMPIYSDRARYVGEVQDVVLDVDEGKVLGLGFGYRGGKVTSVPYESIVAIGDIILVESKRTVEQTTIEQEAVEEESES
ncbi:hypothetical protein AKJ48_00040 [candidate division MSBL1 archaeon SCGC-AAA261O19]|uniref:PRC-barrel domain-containing protein n=1 Tax=candidate division MSBL1 archaeon SCGC-AAA261O19 TaxID=1698277 RepID=A0A133VF76_9EURY|nr:hypothetical protein AKJ48_00040 [candidate division MSBL1 archaeon SCGC-AAA261O19]